MPKPMTDLRQRILDCCDGPEGHKRMTLRNRVPCLLRPDVTRAMIEMLADGSLISVKALKGDRWGSRLYSDPAHAAAAVASADAARDALKARRKEKKRAADKVRVKRAPVALKSKPLAPLKAKDTRPVDYRGVVPKQCPSGKDFRHTFHPPEGWKGGHVNAMECRPYLAQVIRL